METERTHNNAFRNDERSSHWSTIYVDELKTMGWRFVSGKDGGLGSKFIAYHDERTPSLVNEWRKTNNPVEISIVMVSPNSSVEQLPARALGYAATALSIAKFMQETGVNISTFRIMSPCKINAFCNGGNRDQQILNAEKYQTLVQKYKESYLPDLKDVDITLDTGMPITENALSLLTSKSEQILKNYPELAYSLIDVASRYSQNGQAEYSIDGDLLPLVYLLAHPEAWGYSDEELLFAPNGRRRINFMPASELRYLRAMKKTEGIWQPSTNKEIATVISVKNLFAPYYSIWPDEPTIGDLKNPDSSLSVQTSKLKQLSGRAEVAEIIQNLNQLKSHQEQVNFKRKQKRLGPASLLHKIILSI